MPKQQQARESVCRIALFGFIFWIQNLEYFRSTFQLFLVADGEVLALSFFVGCHTDSHLRSIHHGELKANPEGPEGINNNGGHGL
jgi:hypothetical protein